MQQVHGALVVGQRRVGGLLDRDGKGRLFGLAAQIAEDGVGLVDSTSNGTTTVTIYALSRYELAA